MNSEIKAAWIKKLRNGEVKQCKGTLKNNLGEMCCIGVLREVIAPRSNYLSNNTSLLSIEHETKAGISSEHCSILAEMNDEGQSFKEIADYIEANV